MHIVGFTLFILSLLLLSNGVVAATDGGEYKALQKQWAVAKYQTSEDQREEAFKALADESERVVDAHPDSAEILIWRAIILSTYAGEKGGLGALSLVKEAKMLLEQAEQLDAEALQGSIYTSLGSLYYQVPGWPIGFGDDDKALEYLQKALSINPDGMDANYFYGDFLIEEGEYAEAVKVLEKAIQAPARAERPLADQGRKTEIKLALDKARKAL